MIIKDNPQFILLWVANNYLNDSQFKELLNDISSGSRGFLKKFTNHFNIERLRESPIIWQDIWIYNYIVYDCKRKRLVRSKLLSQYEREILIPAKKSLSDLNEYINKSLG